VRPRQFRFVARRLPLKCWESGKRGSPRALAPPPTREAAPRVTGFCGASVRIGISTGGAAPQTGIAEGLTLSIPFLNRRNLGGGTSPGPGKYSIDVGNRIFEGTANAS